MGADTTEKKSGFRLFEKGCGFRAGAKDLLKYTNGSTLSSAIISTIFGCTGSCLVTIAASEAAGFTTAETVSWIFGIYVFGGLLGAIMSLYYKMPISGAFSIPGATLMGTALAGYSFQGGGWRICHRWRDCVAFRRDGLNRKSDALASAANRYGNDWRMHAQVWYTNRNGYKYLAHRMRVGRVGIFVGTTRNQRVSWSLGGSRGRGHCGDCHKLLCR